MTETNNTPECGCQNEGIAILPVRYTVIPKYLKSSIPSWANLSRVTNLPLADDYQYHVRVMREGFLYCYIPDKLGSKWQIYSIDSKGHLIKQFSNAAAKPITDSEQQEQCHCPQVKSNDSHNAFITIANPENLQVVYIAFSELKWSEKTLKKYEQNPHKRMQVINIAEWQGNAESATIANHNNIQSILDFDPKMNKALLPYDENRQIIFSKDNQNAQTWAVFDEPFSEGRDKQYQFNKKLLDKNSTCEPWSVFKPESSEHLAHSMERYSPSKKPMIFAIEDPVGIATELNGYYNEPYARVLQYQNERRLEYDALSYIEQAKSLAVLKEYYQDYSFPNHNNPYVKKIMVSGKIEHHPDKPMYCTSRGLNTLIREQLYSKPGGYDYYEQFNDFRLYSKVGDEIFDLSVYENYVLKEKKNKIMPGDAAVIKRLQNELVQEYKKDVNDFYNQESALKAQREKDIKKFLQKYEELVNTQPFEDKHNELIKLVDEKYQNRVKQLITWIHDSNFYSTVYNDIDGNQLYSFDDVDNQKIKELMENYETTLQESLKLGEITTEDLEDLRKINIEGILFALTINKVTQGLELCEDGKTFLDSMTNLDYAKPNNDNVNGMLWRMFAYHNDDLLSMIDQVVSKAESDDNKTLVEKSVEKLVSKLDELPYAKIALMFKKLQDVIMTLADLERNDPNNYIRSNIKIKFIGLTIKIRGFTLGETFTTKATQLLQPVFNLLANALYSVSTAMYKVLSLTTAGVLKSTAVTYLHLEYQMLTALVTLDQGPNLGTAKVPLYHQRWELRKRMAINKARTLLNDAVANLDKRLNILFNRTLSQNKANKFLHFILKASDAEPGISNTLSTTLKSMRMAAVVAILELYNFTSLSKTHPNLDENDYYSTLKISAGFALAAACVELMAMVTAATKGMENLVFSLGKTLSGILGGIASFWLIANDVMQIMGINEKSNSGSLKALLEVRILMLTLLGSACTLVGLSYHFIWCREFLTTKAMIKIFEFLGKGVGVKKVASIAAMRLVLWRIAGLVGLIIMVIDFTIDKLSDDNLETWLKRCALRTDKYLMPHNKSHIYKTPEQQASAFENEVLKDMFGIKDNKAQANNITYTINIDEALALIEQDMDNRGFLHD